MNKVDSQHWQQVKEVFESALDCQETERIEFLERVCAGDETLRKEVESLLRSYGEAGSFMETPAVAGAAELLIGEQKKLVAGQSVKHYQILAPIGEGGMGEVYLAKDTTLGRRVALKVLPEYVGQDPDRLRRFKQEARSASTLNHPNVCVIYEIGETDDGRPFIAMEHIDGATLRRRFTEGPLKLTEAIEIALQTSSALAAAHQAGVVHRDIKPENIMLRPDGYVKVLDFGLAKLTERYAMESDSEAPTFHVFSTHSGQLIGTTNYLSPEQARRQQLDERSDIWSLGVVLYEMLTGRMPFTGETPSHAIVAILEQEPMPLTQFLPDVPE